MQRGARERDHLGRQPVDDLRRDGIRRSRGEHERRELDHLALGESPR